MDYWRQLGILPPKDLENCSVTLIGAGGIGSPTAITLAKMGVPNLTIYDFDVVDIHNLPNQIYRIQDLKRLKVEALKEIICEFSDCKVTPINAYFDATTKARGIVICAVDKMSVRQEIWKSIRYNLHVPLYIDARMGAEVLRLHTLKPTDLNSVRWYESTMYGDEDALEAPCTERAIIYTVMMAASLITNQVKKHVKGEPLNKEIIFDMKNVFLVVQ